MGGRKRLVLVPLLVMAGAVTPLLLRGAPAASDVTSASGMAFALEVRSGETALVPPTPRVDGTVSEPDDGYGPVARTAVPLTVPNILSVSGLDSSTQGSGVSGTGTAGFATSSARVAGLSVPLLWLTATTVASRCFSGDRGSSGSTSLLGNVPGTNPLLADPPPNTVLSVPALITAVANEQIVSDTPGQTSITVTGLHIQLLPGALGPGSGLVDIVLARSTCRADVAAPPPTTGTVTDDTFPPPSTTGGPSSTRTTTPTTLGATTTTASTEATPSIPSSPRTPTGPGTREPASLAVSTTDGGRSGPPGTRVRVTGSGYRGCDAVFFFFDGRRIGADRPDDEGNVRKGRLWVPGGADPGPRTITSSCDSSGEPVGASATFDVTGAGVHRTELITSVPAPYNADLAASQLLVSGIVALALLFMVAFPAELFNSTLEANYDEVRGWFGLKRKDPSHVSRRSQGTLFVAFCLFGGALGTLLSPDVDVGWSWVAAVLGLSLVIALVTLTFDATCVAYFSRLGERPALIVLPSTLGIAAVCVAVSRLVDFQPGYFYGVIAGLAFRRDVASELHGRLVALSTVMILTLSAGAWLTWSWVADAAGRPGASFGMLVLDAVMAGIFWAGLDSLVVSLLPLRFLQGGDLQRWSRAAWAVLYGLTLFAFVHIMLRPSTGYVADSRIVPIWVAVELFAAFGAFSVAFWSYFRFRPAR